MNRLVLASAGLIAMALPAVAQTQAHPTYRDLVKPAAFQWQDNDHDRDDRWRNGYGRGTRLSADDQRRFDSYYSRWQEYRRTNNGDEIRSMEGRMQDIYSHYGIPANTPYDRIASNGGGYGGYGNGGYGNGGYGNGGYGNGGYGRWGRDRDHDGDHDGDDRWRGNRGYNQARLSADDQRRFDSYYQRWQQYRATNNQGEVASMEGRMRDIYAHYGIPSNTPFGAVASGRY
jgi:hypothetical protein